MNRHEAGYARALLVGAAHQMAGALGGDHENINRGRRDDLPKMNIETVPPCQRHALFQVRLDIALVHRPLLVVGDEDHDDVRLFHGVGHGLHV